MKRQLSAIKVETTFLTEGLESICAAPVSEKDFAKVVIYWGFFARISLSLKGETASASGR
jgi:hypothetical protein